MFLGLDLGTSNSAVVGHDGTAPRLFKTPEGLDVLPSAIMVDRRGAMLVGKRAYDQAAFSPENVTQGFKRLMGSSTPITFGASGKSISAEEASAEILKALVAQARMTAGDFEVTGAVVTVPAAFNQMQSEATMRAAAAAGLPKVALLQEPIAAAIASIAGAASKSAQFLVYDLGGGTFDAALVQSLSGAATIVGHSGINMLGGRDFDRSLLNAVVRPWLFEHFDLANDFQKDPTYQRLLRVAQYRAELAKIALSTQETDRIFADEVQVAAKDRGGKEIYLDIEVTRRELEALVGDDVDRSIEHCRKLLGDNGYQPSDIDRVVLIGGPSRMPIVKERVQQGLGIRVDLDSDPMTAVAVGAAIYAEGRDWSGHTTTARKSRAAVTTSGPLALRADYPARSSDEHIRIRFKVADPTTIDGHRVQINTSEGWSSGQVDVQSQFDVREVPLGRMGSNVLRLTVYDRSGAVDKAAGQEFVVQKVGASADGMPLMHGIAVSLLDGPPGAEVEKLHTFVRKGTSLPKSGIEQLRAARDLRFGQDESIDFALFEQPDEAITDPALCLPIGSFRLTSQMLERGDVIRRGETVMVAWTIDANGLLSCRIDVPSISGSFNADDMYVSAASHRNFEGGDGAAIAARNIALARGDLEALEGALGASVKDEALALRQRLARIDETFRLSHEADTYRSVSEEARLIRQEIAKLQARPEHQARVVRHELERAMSFYDDHLATVFENRITVQLHRLAGSIREALDRNTAAATRDARKAIEEIQQIIRDELHKAFDFWVMVFEKQAEQRHLAVDKALHDKLVRDGMSAVEARNQDALRMVLGQMQKNMLDLGTGDGNAAVLAGLMR